MNDTQLRELISQRARLAQDIKEATEERRFLDEQIREELTGRGLDSYTDGDFTTKIVSTTRRSIDKKALLANGVAPEIIAKSEKESTSVSLRVTAKKVD